MFDGEFQLHQIRRGRDKRMLLRFVVDHDLQPCEIHSRMRKEANAADLPPVGIVREDELHALRPAHPAERPTGIVAFDFVGIRNDQARLVYSV